MTIELLITLFSLLLGILGIILTVRTRKRHKAALAISNYTSSTYVVDELKDDIKIYFKNEQIEKLNLIEFTFRNVGNTNLDGNKIIPDKPIMIYIPEGSKIYHYSIIEAGRQGILPNITRISDNKIQLGFELLKPNEAIRIKIFTDANKKQLKVSGRIQDFENFSEMQINTKASQSYLRPDAFTWLGVVVIFLAAYTINFTLKRAVSLLNWKHFSFRYTISLSNSQKSDSLKFVQDFRDDSTYYCLFYGKPDTIISHNFVIDSLRFVRKEFLYEGENLPTKRIKNIKDNLFTYDAVTFLYNNFNISLAGLLMCFVFFFMLYQNFGWVFRDWKILTPREKLQIFPTPVQRILARFGRKNGTFQE